MVKFLIVGSGGREASFAMHLMKDVEVYAVMGHENPLIIDCVLQSGGEYLVGDADSPDTILKFAMQHSIAYAFVNADQPLANGVVDTLLQNGIKAIGGTQAATRIEWDKIYAIDMMHRVCPEFTPFYLVVSDHTSLSEALDRFKSHNLQVVVKPQGLTGGKGVKVMPVHLPTYDDCYQYAASLLDKGPDESVLLVERLEGIEFTIMGITDGRNLVMAPASYDYPFRYEGDVGPGTGGMGCFTAPSDRLPFMTDGDLADCRVIMQRVIDDMRHAGLSFMGVLNGGFFKTVDGIRFMEFNGRFGDPEGLNVLSVLDGSLYDVLLHIWNGTVSGDVITFAKKASVTKYLVAEEYPESSSTATDFTVDVNAIKEMGIQTYFASCIRIDDTTYRTLKKSRVVALGAASDTIQEASDIINKAISLHIHGSLEYRSDIGSTESLQRLH